MPTLFLDQAPAPPLTPGPNPLTTGQVLADYDIDLVIFKIYGSQILTISRAEEMLLYDRRLVVKCYHFLTADKRLALPLNACRAVILGEIIKVWYEVSGFEVPAKVTQRQEERMAKAKAATVETEAAATTTEAPVKEPRITNRSIIEAGLLAGKPDEEILAEVKEHFPNGKADEKHIGYYRHFMIKDGQLEAPPKPTEEEKAAALAERKAAKDAAREEAKAAKAAAAAPPAPAKVAAKPALVKSTPAAAAPAARPKAGARR